MACGADPQVEAVNGDAADAEQIGDVIANNDLQNTIFDSEAKIADDAPDSAHGEFIHADQGGDKPDEFADPPDGKGEKPDGFAEQPDGKGEKPDGFQDAADGTDDKPDALPDAADGQDEKPEGIADTADGIDEKPDGVLDSADGTPDKPDGLSDTPDGQAVDGFPEMLDEEAAKIDSSSLEVDLGEDAADATDVPLGAEVDTSPDLLVNVDVQAVDEASDTSDAADADGATADAAEIKCAAAIDCAKKPAAACQVWICQAAVCAAVDAADGTPCDDGDACSVGELCAAGKCAQGLAKICNDGNACTSDACEINSGGCLFVAVKLPCDDGNFCTKEACEPLAGCVAVAVDDGKMCDDGNACTVKEVCGDGACKGGLALDCDDGKFCTNDSCEPKAGNCNWTAKFGACDDGDSCTANDACKTGNCSGDAKACDDKNICTTDSCSKGDCVYQPIAEGVNVACNDGNPCSNSDSCKGETCSGIPIDLKGCDDGNTCTSEGCDAKSGACTHIVQAGPCDDGNFCSSGDGCDAKGICLAGAKFACEDGNVCTADTCNAQQSKCIYTNAVDGGVCDDGIACTDSSTCKNGLCAPTKSTCTLLSDSYECVAGGAGWDLPKPFGYKVLWAVDQTPILPQQQKFQCTLNYNNGLNYCDFPLGGNLCLGTPNVTATSPLIDTSNKAGVARIRFDTFYELDGPKPGGTGFGDTKTDVPLVVLREEGTKIILDQFLLSKSTNNCGGPCQGNWRAIDVEVPKVSGKFFRVEFSLQAPNNQGNSGRGWFIDNLKIQLDFSAEECGNALDDDGNGKVDCQDPVCKGQPGC